LEELVKSQHLMVADPGGKFKVTSVFFFLSNTSISTTALVIISTTVWVTHRMRDACFVLVALLTLGISHSLSPAHHSVVDIDLMPMQVRPLLLMLHTTTTHALPWGSTHKREHAAAAGCRGEESRAEPSVTGVDSFGVHKSHSTPQAPVVVAV
jgi:hypothetical protein